MDNITDSKSDTYKIKKVLQKEVLQKDTTISEEEIDAFSREIARLTKQNIKQISVNSYEAGKAIERIVDKLNNINKTSIL